MSIKALLTKVKKRILENIFEDRFNCISCNCEMPPSRDGLCEKCRFAMPYIVNPCLKCGKSCNTITMYCLGCQQNERQFDVCYSVFDHEDAAASLLYAFKFRGERYLSKYLSALLADCFIDNLLEADYIVPVPMHKKGVSVRGYNQCELLCADLSNRLNIPTLNCLVKPVETKKQMTLAKAERAENVKGAFLCNADLQFKTILLVDDVLTTGATLNECANVLKKAGAVTVNCLTLNNVKDMYIETDTDIMADAFSEGNF